MLIGIGMGIGGRAGAGGGAVGMITPIGAGGASATTISPTGVATGDLMIGFAFKSTVTAPTHDATGGELIATYSSNGSSANIFWKYAENSTPAFGTHTGASRVQWVASRFSAPPANPIGAFARSAANTSLIMGWAGLTLTKQGSHVITFGFRAADEAITDRPGAVSVSGTAGVSTRYKPMRSDGVVTSWPLENVAQAVTGYHQSIAIEIGY
jgi:hypothetical protein